MDMDPAPAECGAREPAHAAAVGRARAAAIELLTCAADPALTAEFETVTLQVADADVTHRILVGFLLIEQLTVVGPNPDQPLPNWATNMAAAVRTGRAEQVRAELTRRLADSTHPADRVDALRLLAISCRPDLPAVRRWAITAVADPDAELRRTPGHRSSRTGS